MSSSPSSKLDTIQLAETVLGQPYFSDPSTEAALHADPTQFTSEAYNARHLTHIAVLRGLATLRRVDRQTQLGFDPNAWQPSDGGIEELRAQLMPAIARVAMLNSFDDWMLKTNQARDAGLWPLQQVVMHDTRTTLNTAPPEARDQNSAFGLGTRFELATGFGKTVVALKTAEAIGISKTIGGDVPVNSRMLYVTSRKHLLKQFKKDANEYTPAIPVTRLRTNIIQPPDGITTVTYPGLLRRLKRDPHFLNNYRGGVITFDEAHNTLGRLFQEKMEDLKRDTLLFLYTATPAYADGRAIAKLFPHLTSEYDIPTCIRSGVIRGVQLLAIATGQELIVDTRDLDADTLIKYGFRDRDLASLVDNDERNAQIADLAQAFVESGKPTYISCIAGRRCLHSEKLKEILDQRLITDHVTGERRPLRSEVVNSYVPYAEVERRKAAFDAEDIDVLLDTGLLGEGYHTDGLLAMILSAPTTSPLRHLQRFGRGLHLGKHDKLVIGHTVVAELFDTLTYVSYDNGEILAQQAAKRYFTSWDIFGDHNFENGVIYDKTGRASPPRNTRNEDQIVEGVKLPPHIIRLVHQADAELLGTAVFVQELKHRFGPPPEGLSPLSELIKAAGCQGIMDTEFARKAIKRGLDIDSVLYDGLNHPVFCAPNTEEVITLLKETPILGKPPKDWRAGGGIAKAFSISDRSVAKAIKELGPTLQGRLYSSRGSRDNEGIRFYSPSDQERIYARAKPLEDIAPGDHTAASIAKEYGTTQQTVKAFFMSRGHVGRDKKGPKGLRTATFSDEQREAYREYHQGREVPAGAVFITDVINVLGIARDTFDKRLKREHLGIYIRHGNGNKRFIEAEMLAYIVGFVEPSLAGVVDLDAYAERHDMRPQAVSAIMHKHGWQDKHTVRIGIATLLRPDIIPTLDKAILGEKIHFAAKIQSMSQILELAEEEIQSVVLPSGSKLVRIQSTLEKLGWSIESLRALMRVARVPRQALVQDPATQELIIHEGFMNRLLNHASRLPFAPDQYYPLNEAVQKLHMNSSDELIALIVANSIEPEVLQVFRKDSHMNPSYIGIDLYLSAQSLVRIARTRTKTNR